MLSWPNAFMTVTETVLLFFIQTVDIWAVLFDSDFISVEYFYCIILTTTVDRNNKRNTMDAGIPPLTSPLRSTRIVSQVAECRNEAVDPARNNEHRLGIIIVC